MNRKNIEGESNTWHGVLAPLSAMAVFCLPALFELRLRLRMAQVNLVERMPKKGHNSYGWPWNGKQDVMIIEKNASVTDLQTLRNQNYLWSILILPQVIILTNGHCYTVLLLRYHKKMGFITNKFSNFFSFQSRNTKDIIIFFFVFRWKRGWQLGENSPREFELTESVEITVQLSYWTSYWKGVNKKL